MNLPPVLVEIFDPAGRYMRRHDPSPPRRRHRELSVRSRRRPFRGGVVFGPDVPGGARHATPEELATLRGLAQQDRARYEIALEAARRRWSQQALVSAGELLASGTTVLSVEGGQVRGQLIRFWHGDSVLDLTTSSRDTRNPGRSMARLSRGQNTSTDVIAFYLIHQVAQLQDRLS
jgi:hypothetical protein